MEPLCEPDEEAVSGGSKVRHKCRRSYDDDVNPSFFLTRPLMCSVVICHVSCKKAGLELAQGFPSCFISGDTWGQSHQARVLRVMARSDSKNYLKTFRKAPTTRTTRRRLRTTHRTTRTTPKTDRTTTRIILTTPRRKRTAPRTTRTTR